MAESAFGIDHGEVSKSFGAGLNELGAGAKKMAQGIHPIKGAKQFGLGFSSPKMVGSMHATGAHMPAMANAGSKVRMNLNANKKAYGIGATAAGASGVAGFRMGRRNRNA